MVKKKLGISVLIKTGPAAKLLSWQQHNRCHFGLFMIRISGAKFEEHCLNISRYILYSLFYNFSCKPLDIIIPNLHNTKTISLKQKRNKNSKEENSIHLYFEKSFKYEAIIFHVIYTFIPCIWCKVKFNWALLICNQTWPAVTIHCRKHGVNCLWFNFRWTICKFKMTLTYIRITQLVN